MTTPAVREDPQASRFVLETEAGTAILDYAIRHTTMVLTHTEVPPAARGRGLGEQLARAAVTTARSRGLAVVAQCPFVRAFLQKHPELAQNT